MPRPRYHAGPSVRVVTDGEGFVILSSPHPVHRGAVRYGRTVGRWIAISSTVTGNPLKTFHRSERLKAVQWLSEIVGDAYRRDVRSMFTGPQRLAMGRNLCPHHVDCADPAECSITRPDHRHLCYGVPDSPFTVYCPDHDTSRGDGFV